MLGGCIPPLRFRLSSKPSWLRVHNEAEVVRWKSLKYQFHSILDMSWRNISAVIENRLFLGKSVFLLILSLLTFDWIPSSIMAARSTRSMAENRITHILSVCSDPIPGEVPASGIRHMRISIDDVDYADLLIHLPSACKFIDQALRSGGVVFVHCVQGISRSAAVVAAYCRPSILLLISLVFN